MSQILSAGTPAPFLTGKDQNGNDISIQDFAGKKVVLFFYPKDDTPTCTKEACNLRDNHVLLNQQGFVVLGISTDGEKSHQKFIRKYELPFSLITDPDQEWVNAYGVWGEKQMFGRKYMGTFRTTFIIDEQGMISHVIDKVQSADHAQQILDITGS